MLKYMARRLGLLTLTLIGISAMIFVIVQILPGDAVDQILEAWVESEGGAHDQLRKKLGLDRPLHVQYFTWLWDILHGDLGRSLSMEAPIAPILIERLGFSLRLAIPALVISVSLSLVLGVIAAIKPNGFLDHAITVITLTGVSVPAFVSGSLFILIFAAWLQWFPSTSSLSEGEGFFHWAYVLAMPIAVLSLEALAHLTRITRSSMIEVLKTPYVRTARLKGLPKRLVIYKHALRNAMLPTVTVIAFNIGWMLGGVVLVEQVFSYPGLGSLVLFSIEQRDTPLLQASMFFVATGYCVANLVADMAYALLDPRIRYS
ncbi:MAG: ABC transporter permease [Rhodospirillaceae bacterium]|nr:ABC transporter permease [Rhodospirillaceae bacterium]MBT3909139.1 ABC transporter permease [Rhodospirillaceae bacterium]MBT5296997.1 ABC transporter permease [Rhodospirillaceae bacterium]MBT5514053.1 ABC transporter permease [Rhodospirillaceae bacterium]MBT6086509.1 ABC transporter permease [Rhodospirillaceae bacterium]